MAVLLTLPFFSVLLAVGYVGGCLACFLLYSWIYSRIARRVPAQHVVVLGAGLRGGRTVTPLLAGRVDAGIAQYRALRAKGLDSVLVMSGGRGGDEKVSEAQAMAEHAFSRGIPREHVLLEDRSRTTLENLRFSRQLIAGTDAGADAGSDAEDRGVVATRERRAPLAVFEPFTPQALIVTSDYHALRAAMYAREVGLDAHAIGARTARYYWPSAALREFIAVVNERRMKHLILLVLVAVPLPLVMLLGAL